MITYKTVMAAKKLGIRYSRLSSLLRAEKIPKPKKDSSGDYLWSEDDLENVRQALPIDYRKKGMRKLIKKAKPLVTKDGDGLSEI